MSATTAEHRPRRMAPEDRKQALIASALELFSRDSPERVSMEDVAAHAEVSRALVYRYFSNIQEIHVAALRSAVDVLVERLTRPREGDLLTQLHDTIGEFVTFAEEHAAGYIALLRSGSVIATSETSTLVDEVRHVAVQEVLNRLDIAEPTPFMLLTLRCWIAACEGALLTWLQERTLAKDELVPWLSGQLVAMVTATAGHDPAVAAFVTALAPAPAD